MRKPPVSLATMLPSHSSGADGVNAARRACCSAVRSVIVSPARRAENTIWSTATASSPSKSARSVVMVSVAASYIPWPTPTSPSICSGCSSK